MYSGPSIEQMCSSVPHRSRWNQRERNCCGRKVRRSYFLRKLQRNEHLAVVYEFGMEISKNESEAEKPYHLAVTTDKNPIAMYNLMLLYIFGSPAVGSQEKSSLQAFRVTQSGFSACTSILHRWEIERTTSLLKTDDSVHELSRRWSARRFRIEEIGESLVYVKIVCDIGWWRISINRPVSQKHWILVKVFFTVHKRYSSLYVWELQSMTGKHKRRERGISLCSKSLQDICRWLRQLHCNKRFFVGLLPSQMSHYCVR